MNTLFRTGHEIASHGVGHFDGAAWSSTQWQEEFNIFDRLLANCAGNNGLPADQGLAFRPGDIKGFRAPFLSFGPGLEAALADHGYRYDATKAGRAGEWPEKRDNIWRFKLASIPLSGYRRTPLSMDYNFFTAHSLENPGLFEDLDGLKKSVVEAYLGYFKRNYFGNRAPIHIGHHFTDYRGLVYRHALMEFIETIVDRPDVRFCTYATLADELDARGAAQQERLLAAGPNR